VSLRLTRSDEIGQLGRAFDALVEQLDARARYISELAANVSHEFKTPLTAIRGAAELLCDGADGDPQARRRFLDNNLADTCRLDRLVSRLLDLSRIEATVEQRQHFDLAETVRDVAKQFDTSDAQDQPASRARVLVVGASEPLSIFGNHAHVRDAICALVENAVQHSPPEEPVRLELCRGDARERLIRLRVVDRGSGISEHNLSKIFDRFFTTRSAEGGTGIGLAIVATVAHAHGGDITVESHPNAGSTFTLTLGYGSRS
jgi:two-component system sensor histidine kinase ChvG